MTKKLYGTNYISYKLATLMLSSPIKIFAIPLAHDFETQWSNDTLDVSGPRNLPFPILFVFFAANRIIKRHA